MDDLARIISNNEQDLANAREWWNATSCEDKERLVDEMLTRIRQGPQDDIWTIYRLAWLKFGELAEQHLRLQANPQ